MKIEAVTVCVNYADFLRETAPRNIPLLDRWVVVTSDEDEETREVCRQLGLECLVSREHRREAGQPGLGAGSACFNKGWLVERGLQHLSANGWRLHLDADIALSFQFRRMLECAHLQPEKIYGCDRLMIRSWEQWQAFRRSGWLNHTQHHAVCFPTNAQIGTRWADSFAGYCPIGFFQLWHSSQDEWRGVRTRRYPVAHNTACRTDVQHALQWDRRNRELIPELLVVHLESEPAKGGANWNGRRTRRFGPPMRAQCNFPPS